MNPPSGLAVRTPLFQYRVSDPWVQKAGGCHGPASNPNWRNKEANSPMDEQALFERARFISPASVVNVTAKSENIKIYLSAQLRGRYVEYINAHMVRHFNR